MRASEVAAAIITAGCIWAATSAVAGGVFKLNDISVFDRHHAVESELVPNTGPDTPGEPEDTAVQQDARSGA